MAALLLPAGRKVYGCNLTYKLSNFGTGIDAWTSMWAEWDWAGWIKPQIDYVVGNGIGAQCVRLQGSLDGVALGQFTQTTYNTRWRQFLQYCKDLGVYAYPSPGVTRQMASYTDAQLGATINAIVSVFGEFSNVIGCDVIQEANDQQVSGTQSAYAARIVNIYNLVKPNTSLPLTFSNYFAVTQQYCKDWVALIASAIDYLDFHLYAFAGPYDDSNPIALADFNFWRTTYPGHDIMFGEFGSEQSKTADQQFAFHRSVFNVAAAGDPKFRGALVWTAVDQDTVTSNEWGLYAIDWTRRPARARMLQAMTGGYAAKRN